MFQAQNRETINKTLKVAVTFKIIMTTSRALQDHKTTPELQDQDQDHSLQDQDEDRFFSSQTGLVLRPTVSDHIAVIQNNQTYTNLN